MNLSKLKRFIFNRGAQTFVYYLLSALVLWSVVYLNDTFRYTFNYPIHFTNTANKGIKVLQSDNTISVHVTANGFKMIYNSVFKKEKEITIDLDEFLHDKKSGKYTFSLAKHKTLVLGKLNYLREDVKIMTDSIALAWSPLMSKKVKPLLDINLTFADQYGLYGATAVYPEYVTITGTAVSLKKIHSVSTRKIELNNLSTSSFHYVPLQKYAEYPDVSIPIPYVAVYLPVEMFTETEIDVPITIPENLQNRIRTFPDVAKIICMVALKDYKKITPEMFAVSFQYDSTQNQAALQLELDHFPDFVKKQRLKYDKVDYVIIKK